MEEWKTDRPYNNPYQRPAPGLPQGEYIGQSPKAYPQPYPADLMKDTPFSTDASIMFAALSESHSAPTIRDMLSQNWPPP